MKYIKKTTSGIIVSRIMGGRSNVFLLSKGGMNILIDTSPAMFWPLLKLRLGLIGIHQIDYLILTHAHFDHADNADKIKKQLGARVLIHQEEANNLETGNMSALNGIGVLTGAIIRKVTSGKMPKAFRTLPCTPDILVAEDYDLRKFGFNARIMHTPGHTPGSLSVIVDDELALVGDTVFGVLRTVPPFAADFSCLMRSWKKLLETNCDHFYPSHGSPVKKERLQKVYGKRVVV